MLTNADPYLFIEIDSKPFVYSSGENGLDETGNVDDVSLMDRGLECEKFGVDCSYYLVLGYLVYVSAFALLINLLIWIASNPIRNEKRQYKL